MGSIKKSQNKPNCAGKENFERMNYLYQISNLFGVEQNDNSKSFSRHCTNLMITISKKTVLRIEPKIKRTICKLCKIILIPRKTCKVKVTKRKVKWTCNTCKTSKVYLTNKEYPCWVDNPQSVLEKLEYTNTK
nr:ribonuclease P protein subunit rpr2-like [Onthophagus taurus]XP_022909755.1 ribonuclease P protein subunit rpr2-like [Onthophagus taurus]XP_022909756.1 ribonuclease P protein subunit rpr2-like [Onthophagus taurus]